MELNSQGLADLLRAAEKSRNDCATTGTIEYFFDNTYSDEMCQGVPKQLCFNADETSVEISLPLKIIIPQGEKEGRKIEKFNISCHISAMVTLNANGDDFAPYIIVPLKNLPKDLAPLIAGGKINIGGCMMSAFQIGQKLLFNE